jgi:flavin-dependent dehydrogenase
LRYEVVIVGASFAGLAVASQIFGRVLLIDRLEIGQGQTSACATPLVLLERLGVSESVLQIHRSFHVHTPLNTFDYYPSSFYCTFDYKRFCRTFAQKLYFDFLKAEVKDFDGRVLVTNKGDFKATCFVDCSGWRADLARLISKNRGRQRRLNFALEAYTTIGGEGLHFWLDSKLLGKKLGWFFPHGGRSVVGIGGAANFSQVRESLCALAEQLNIRIDIKTLHGGFLPYQLKVPVEKGVYLVGDAAGQCLPLTGEGIRPAIYFGQKCGEIINHVIKGEIEPTAGLINYTNFVLKHRWFYFILRNLQEVMSRLPDYLITKVLSGLKNTPLLSPSLTWYLKKISPYLKGGGLVAANKQRIVR